MEANIIPAKAIALAILAFPARVMRASPLPCTSGLYVFADSACQFPSCARTRETKESKIGHVKPRLCLVRNETACKYPSSTRFALR